MVKAVVLTALLGVVLFFALTRTQVGRNELRQEIQRQFNDRFAGTLHIGTLQGNLVNDLFASDIRVQAPSGRTVIAIDSLVARPRWVALFSQQLTFRSISVLHPTLTLHRDAEGQWDVMRAFAQPAARPDSAGSLPAFTLADFRIQDGTVTTTRDGPPPALVDQEWLFDYSTTRVDDLHAHATIEWTPGDELVDILALSGSVPSRDVQLSQLQGQILGSTDTWTLNQLRLQTADTDLSLDATLARLSSWADLASAPAMNLDIASSTINFDEIRRIVPRLPLADEITLAAQISGPPSGLVLEAIEVERGASQLNVEGTLTGLPSQLDYELALKDSRLTKADVLAVLPTAPVSTLDLAGPVDVSLYGTGLLPFGSDTLNLRTQTEFTAQSVAGAIQGSFQTTHRPNQQLVYRGNVQTDSLDVSPFPGFPYASALTGTARFAGRGLARQSADAELDLALNASTFAGRRWDSLNVAAQARQGQFTTTAQAWHPAQGYLRAEGSLDLLQARPSYVATLTARRFNLAALPFNRLPPTQLTGQLETRGAGLSPEEASGRLAVVLDSSNVSYRGTTHFIPPHRTELTLAGRNSGAPRFELTGDVATLRLQGDVAFKPLWALGNLWGRALTAAARQEVNKPYSQPLASAAPPDASGPAPPAGLAPSPAASTEPWRNRARQTLLDAGYPSDLTVETTFTIKRADILEALLPFTPHLHTDLEGQLAVTAGADRLVVQSHLAGSTFSIRGLSADSLTVRLDASGTLQAPLAETFTADLNVRSAGARVRGLDLRAPQLTFDFLSRQALLQFESKQDGETGPYRFSATADLLPDRNELTLYDVYLETGGYAWSSTQPSTFDAYADALVIPDLRLTGRHPADDRTQAVRVHGRFSSSPQDTVVAEARNVLLDPFSELANLRRPVGGTVQGQIALAGGWSAPRVSSDLVVDWLSFDRRLLGQLELGSRYVLGSPDVRVDASLRSMPFGADSLAPAYLPHRPRRAEANRIDLSGRVRVPGVGPQALAPISSPDDPLDLQLTVERADLFFFEYIFQDLIENVSGHVTGRAQIRGSWRRPLFSADLYAVDGRFEIPRFNLQYGLNGPIGVDSEGIKLNDVTVSGPDEGRAAVSGAVLFNAYQFFSFDLEATLDELRIIDVARSQDLPFYGRISASGPVTLTGPLSGATLRSSDARTTPDSELFIPVKEGDINGETGFIIFADSTGQIPNLREVSRRDNILADRPEGEPSFLDALDLDLNLLAPEGSTVHLVFDPLLGDVVTAVGSGRIQIQRQEGEFFTYGTLEVNSGEYLFTAGEVFVRRFSIDGGSITWDGSPTNALLDLDASYRTRASTAGLAQARDRQRIPVMIQLDITGRVESPRVDLSLGIDSRDRDVSFAGEALQSIFNQPDLATDDLATEYATSVLLTNTFLLTTSSVSGRQQSPGDAGDRLTDAGNQLAFNSVSQLVASQLNRYLSEALPNLDVNLGVQGEDPQDLDVIYGVALRLLDERLIIRGEGVYQGDEEQRRRTEGLEGEFVVELRLSRNVSAEAFYRRTGDDILSDQTLTSTTGAGLSYQTEFTSWRAFFQRLFDWFIPGDDDAPQTVPPPVPAPADTAVVDSVAADSTAP